MLGREGVVELRAGLRPFINTGSRAGRTDAVGHQGFGPAIFGPARTDRGISEKLKHRRLMVTLEEICFEGGQHVAEQNVDDFLRLEARSEERRVGKECRCRRSEYQ